MEELENDDVIDIEIQKLITAPEDDEALALVELQVVSALIDGLIDDEVIEDIPDYEAEESEKKAWIEKFMPIIREKLREEDGI